MKLAEKAIEAQRKAGYVVPGAPMTALAPTTSIAIPAAMAAESQAKMIKYAIIIGIGFLLLKYVK